MDLLFQQVGDSQSTNETFKQEVKSTLLNSQNASEALDDSLEEEITEVNVTGKHSNLNSSRQAKHGNRNQYNRWTKNSIFCQCQRERQDFTDFNTFLCDKKTKVLYTLRDQSWRSSVLVPIDDEELVSILVNRQGWQLKVQLRNFTTASIFNDGEVYTSAINAERFQIRKRKCQQGTVFYVAGSNVYNYAPTCETTSRFTTLVTKKIRKVSYDNQLFCFESYVNNFLLQICSEQFVYYSQDKLQIYGYVNVNVNLLFTVISPSGKRQFDIDTQGSSITNVLSRVQSQIEAEAIKAFGVSNSSKRLPYEESKLLGSFKEVKTQTDVTWKKKVKENLDSIFNQSNATNNTSVNHTEIFVNGSQNASEVTRQSTADNRWNFGIDKFIQCSLTLIVILLSGAIGSCFFFERLLEPLTGKQELFNIFEQLERLKNQKLLLFREELKQGQKQIDLSHLEKEGLDQLIQRMKDDCLKQQTILQGQGISAQSRVQVVRWKLIAALVVGLVAGFLLYGTDAFSSTYKQYKSIKKP